MLFFSRPFLSLSIFLSCPATLHFHILATIFFKSLSSKVINPEHHKYPERKDTQQAGPSNSSRDSEFINSVFTLETPENIFSICYSKFSNCDKVVSFLLLCSLFS